MSKEEITAALREVMQEEMKQFYVERQQHYDDHCFVRDARELAHRMKNTAASTITKAGIWGLLALLVLGFLAWLRGKLGITI